jgi:hypothetical protein
MTFRLREWWLRWREPFRHREKAAGPRMQASHRAPRLGLGDCGLHPRDGALLLIGAWLWVNADSAHRLIPETPAPATALLGLQPI